MRNGPLLKPAPPKSIQVHQSARALRICLQAPLPWLHWLWLGLARPSTVVWCNSSNFLQGVFTFPCWSSVWGIGATIAFLKLKCLVRCRLLRNRIYPKALWPGILYISALQNQPELEITANWAFPSFVATLCISIQILGTVIFFILRTILEGDT